MPFQRLIAEPLIGLTQLNPGFDDPDTRAGKFRKFAKPRTAHVKTVTGGLRQQQCEIAVPVLHQIGRRHHAAGRGVVADHRNADTTQFAVEQNHRNRQRGEQHDIRSRNTAAGSHQNQSIAIIRPDLPVEIRRHLQHGVGKCVTVFAFRTPAETPLQLLVIFARPVRQHHPDPGQSALCGRSDEPSGPRPAHHNARGAKFIQHPFHSTLAGRKTLHQTADCRQLRIRSGTLRLASDLH